MASNAYQLDNFIRILDSWGLTEIVLPFLIIFIIFFATLQKTKILGEGKRRFNVLFAFAVAALVVIPHVLGRYPEQYDIVRIMNESIPNVSIIIVAIIMLLTIVGVLGGERNWMGGALSGWVAVAATVAIVWIFGASARWWSGWAWFNRFFGSDAIAVAIMVLVFAVVVWWITKGDDSEHGTHMAQTIGNSFRDFFAPKK